MSGSTDQYQPVITPQPQHTRPTPNQEPITRIFSPQPRREFLPLFPATTERPSPLSSHFQATFA